MKRLQIFPVILALSSTLTCSAQIKAGTIVIRRESTDDSVAYYDTDVQVKQASYLNMILGSWNIITMKRQARMEPEYPINIYLTLNKDSSFTGSAGCNTFAGKFSLKGSSIRFNTVSPTSQKSCAYADQETWFTKLLQNTISAFTVSGDSLLLRDGASNIVFETTKRVEEPEAPAPPKPAEQPASPQPPAVSPAAPAAPARPVMPAKKPVPAAGQKKVKTKTK